MLQYMMLEHRVRTRHRDLVNEAANERLLRAATRQAMAILARITPLVDRQSPVEEVVEQEIERSRRVPA